MTLFSRIGFPAAVTAFAAAVVLDFGRAGEKTLLARFAKLTKL